MKLVRGDDGIWVVERDEDIEEIHVTKDVDDDEPIIELPGGVV